jgi:Tfp pilus assembly protein PilF
MKRNLNLFLAPSFFAAIFAVNPLFSQEGTLPATEAPTATTAAETPLIDAKLQAELQIAADSFNKRDVAEALKKLEVICTANPQLAPPRIILAQWFSRANIPNGVAASLNAATTDSPTDPEAFILLGEIALRKGETAAATLFFQKGTELITAFNADANRKKVMTLSLLRNQTVLAEMRQDWKAMESYTDKRLALEGQTPELLRIKAVALFRRHQDKDAAGYLTLADKAAADKEKKGLPAEAILSQLYTSRGDAESVGYGKGYLENAVRKYPKNPEVLALSVGRKLADGDLEGARQLAEALVKEDAKAKQVLANVALFQGDYATAEKIYQEIVVASPSNIGATNGLALALCEQNDKEKLKRAGEYAVENVKKNDKNGDLLATLGWILFKSQNYQQSGKVLQQAAAGGNISPQTAYYLAELQNQAGHKDDARKLLEAALKDTRPFSKKAAAQKLLATLPAAAPAPTTTAPVSVPR